MDPSYNNSFGSFQNSAGGVISSVPSASEGRKLRKGPIIAGIVFVVVALVAVVWYLVTGGVGTSKLEKKAPEFYDLMVYIEEGKELSPADDEVENASESAGEGEYVAEVDESEEDECDEDEACITDKDYESLIYAVRITESMGGDAIEGYYARMSEKEANFLESIGEARDSELISQYRNVLAVMDGAVNYEANTIKILEAYLQGGRERAVQAVDNMMDCENSGSLGDICDAEKSYYLARLEEYDFYGKYRCLDVISGEDESDTIIETVYDDECMEIEYGEGYYDAYEAFVGNNPSMEYYGVFRSFEALKAISDEVKTQNKALSEELMNA